MRIKGLTMAMLVGLIAMLTGCASIDQTALTKSPGGVKNTQILTTDKSTYNFDEKIKVSFFNSPGNDSDWICIVPAGSPDTEPGDYKYMPKRLDQGSLLFDPPSPGKYEARAYYNYGRNGYVVSGRHPFSVAAAKGIATPAVQPVKATRDDYVFFQTVTFGDKNKALTGFSTTGSMAVLKTPNDNMVDYELWTRGQGSSGQNQKKKDSAYTQVRFSRNPTTEEVSFSTKGFGLVEDVVNQIMNQVDKNPRVEGTWNQEISLKLLGTHLPRKLAFHFNVQKIELKPGVQALLIRTYSDVFKIEILPTANNADSGVFSGSYKGALIYSPEDHRLYQMASEFDALKGEETLQIQDTSFLAGLDGKPVYPLLDMREVLDLKKQDKPAPLVSMPLWAVQAVKVQQVVSLASATTAERASNPSILPIIAQLVEIDGYSGIIGLPSSSSLIESYGSTQGGQAGELAGRFFSTVGSEALGASGLLPETMLASTVPILGPLATAYSVYTMYTIAADMTAIALAADLAKLTPFDWPKGDPLDRIAQADKMFDLQEPIQAAADPGPVPEPPAAPKASGRSGWVLPTVIAGGAAVAAGVALGLSGGTSTTSSSSSSNSACYASDCCTTSGGIQVKGVPIPTSCGKCPSNTTNSGTNAIYNGISYFQCNCNGC